MGWYKRLVASCSPPKPTGGGKSWRRAHEHRVSSNHTVVLFGRLPEAGKLCRRPVTACAGGWLLPWTRGRRAAETGCVCSGQEGTPMPHRSRRQRRGNAQPPRRVCGQLLRRYPTAVCGQTNVAAPSRRVGVAGRGGESRFGRLPRRCPTAMPQAFSKQLCGAGNSGLCCGPGRSSWCGVLSSSGALAMSWWGTQGGSRRVEMRAAGRLQRR